MSIYLVNKVSKKSGGQYRLTEKGHDAVDEMIAFPEIESENYKAEVNKNFLGKTRLTATNYSMYLSELWQDTALLF